VLVILWLWELILTPYTRTNTLPPPPPPASAPVDSLQTSMCVDFVFNETNTKHIMQVGVVSDVQMVAA
jgi:hypothetical protein